MICVLCLFYFVGLHDSFFLHLLVLDQLVSVLCLNGVCVFAYLIVCGLHDCLYMSVLGKCLLLSCLSGTAKHEDPYICTYIQLCIYVRVRYLTCF